MCVCGRSFNSVKSLSAHKASCKIYYLHRDGNLDIYNSRQQNLHKSAKTAALVRGAKQSELAKIRRDTALATWISEQHRCQHCGKIMTEYFGTGKYCGYSCANSRVHSTTTKLKISKSIAEFYDNASIQYKCHRYPVKLYFCINCNAPIWSSRKQSYCSDSCKQLHLQYKQFKKIIAKPTRQIYYYQCNFNFDVKDYPELFDLSLYDKYGYYDPIYNPDGIIMDHKYSKYSGLSNCIDPYILAHPCNCELIRQSENSRKYTDNSITIDQLIFNIKQFNAIQAYPNIINYTGIHNYHTVNMLL